MPFTLTMPKLSPTMEAGTIAKWRVKVGDRIKAGDVLMEVATDKATVEHTALDEGYLRKIIVEEGGEAVVNQPIAIFTETKDESIEGYQPVGAMSQAPKEALETRTQIKTDEPAPLVEQKSAPRASGLQQPAFVPQPPLENYEMNIPEGEIPSRIVASPFAKKIAKEKGLDLSTVKGSGPNHRIMSRDLEQAQPTGTVTFGRREKPIDPPGAYEEISLSPVRKVIAQRLQESKTFIPHFYVTQDVNAEPLWLMREQLKAGGLKSTVNDMVIRACALALRENPNINSGFNSVNQTIIRFKTIDIAVAVSVDSGLITPIIRYADFKNLGQLSIESKALAAKAREGKLTREEYMGGSFTISNLGMFGVSQFSAIINPPQAGLLAIGGIEERPVIRNGFVVAGKIMSITFSGDHRVVDGADGARFVKTVQKYLENPALLLV